MIVFRSVRPPHSQKPEHRRSGEGEGSDAGDGEAGGREPDLRSLVHDVRNSLTTIKLAIQALAVGKEPLSERARRRLEIARREVDKIADRMGELATPTREPLRQRPERS